MLLTNGRIYTLAPGDPEQSVVDTLVVREGRVAFAGWRQEISPATGEPVVDLAGRAVLPGPVDAHGHLWWLARGRLTVDLAGTTSEEAAARRVAEAASRVPPGEWILGRGWDQTRWPGERLPTRASLDRAAPRHPVSLRRVDGHATWASSAALRIAGVARATSDPPGGRVVKDAAGEPSGLLIDLAQRLVEAHEPRPGDDAFDRALREAVAECLSKGLTGVHEMGVDRAGLDAFRRLVARGELPLRLYVAVRGSATSAWQEAMARGPEASRDGRLVVGAVKLMVDGALGSRGAALHAPYCDDPGNAGLLLLPPDELARHTREAAARGFQVCVHAIGDRANTLTLDAFEQALAALPAEDYRFRVEHAQVLRSADLPRFRRLGVIPSMQATHATSDLPWAEARLGADRLEGAYAWRSMLRTGVVIAGGSDFPVEDPNPFHGIHAAVTRRPRDGRHAGWQPGQRMTRAEAVRSYTTWNAYACRREADLGSLEPGKRADLVVLSDDVFAVPDDRIATIVPVLTMVGGEIVYRRDEEATSPAPGWPG